MCCILCEEPIRSLTFGLAAVGVVTIIRTVQKSLSGPPKNEAQTEVPVAPAATDNAP